MMVDSGATKFTPVSLGYPLSVFNKHSTLKRTLGRPKLNESIDGLIHPFINWLIDSCIDHFIHFKKEDSDLWFVNNDLYITSTEQSTHQDSVKQKCLRHLFPTLFPCSVFFAKRNLVVGRLISLSSLVYRFIDIENDSNSNTRWSQRLEDNW